MKLCISYVLVRYPIGVSVDESDRERNSKIRILSAFESGGVVCCARLEESCASLTLSPISSLFRDLKMNSKW